MTEYVIKKENTMALINCPECSKSVSDKAAACPDCAYPIAQAAYSSSAAVIPVTTIEQTSKKYKQQKLIAAGLIIFGLLLLANEHGTIGAWMLFAGLITALYSIFGSWWDHS